MFEVNNKDTRTTLLAQIFHTLSYSVYIVNFEHLFAGWVAKWHVINLLPAFVTVKIIYESLFSEDYFPWTQDVFWIRRAECTLSFVSCVQGDGLRIISTATSSFMKCNINSKTTCTCPWKNQNAIISMQVEYLPVIYIYSAVVFCKIFVVKNFSKLRL